jgi:hypothetical protein
VQIEMRKIGYARVSSAHQNLDRQIAALRAERVHVIFREKASGKSTKGRPELEKAIDELGTGDVLVLAEWDRCTRSASSHRPTSERGAHCSSEARHQIRPKTEADRISARGVEEAPDCRGKLSANCEDVRRPPQHGVPAGLRWWRRRIGRVAVDFSA